MRAIWEPTATGRALPDRGSCEDLQREYEEDPSYTRALYNFRRADEVHRSADEFHPEVDLADDDHAVRWGHISRTPLDAADPPRRKGDGTKEMRTWTKEQLKAFLEAMKDERLSPRGTRSPWPACAEARPSAYAGATSTSRAGASRASRPHPKWPRGHRERAEDGQGTPRHRPRPGHRRGLEGSGGTPARWAAGVGRSVGWDRPRLHPGERRRPRPGDRNALLPAGGEEVDAAPDSLARLAPHPRHPGTTGRHPPEGRLRASRPRDHLDHARHLLARHPAMQEEAAAMIAVSFTLSRCYCRCRTAATGRREQQRRRSLHVGHAGATHGSTCTGHNMVGRRSRCTRRFCQRATDSTTTAPSTASTLVRRVFPRPAVPKQGVAGLETPS